MQAKRIKIAKTPIIYGGAPSLGAMPIIVITESAPISITLAVPIMKCFLKRGLNDRATIAIASGPQIPHLKIKTSN